MSRPKGRNFKTYEIILKYALTYPDKILYATEIANSFSDYEITRQGWSLCFLKLKKLGYIIPTEKSYHGQGYILNPNCNETVKQDLERLRCR